MEKITHFISEIIDNDIEAGFSHKIHTRFPPEPNGYLHIGSAKAIWINYSMSKQYGGEFNLRFDDTNPIKEDDEYVEAIERDLRWLGAPPDHIFYGSDYFEKCYEFAVKLIKDGKAYVCNLSAQEMRDTRGTLTEPGVESPYRNRSIEENLELFERMRSGELQDGECVLRAKIDMASPNMNMRDPAIYRILHVGHHRQGDKWCVYPLYDYAHPIQDALEGITHSLCSIEFENHRPLYDWVLESIGGFDPRPHQHEFARLNVSNTVMSKRYLRYLVEKGLVDGWDDPRMPTLCGLRRRGYTPESIFEFVKRAGVSKVYSLVDIGQLEFCIRDELNRTADRKVAVLDPVKLIIDNYPESLTEEVELQNNTEAENAGTRKVPFTKELYIERSDFEETPPPKFFRLFPGNEVRLMGTYFVRCTHCVKDNDGSVTEVHCTYDPDTRTGSSPEGRKVKGTIHWISAAHAIDATLQLYDRLFTKEDLNDIPEDASLDDYINPQSVVTVTGAKLEPSLKDARPEEKFQFVRTGYFCADMKHPGVFNRVVSLKDSYKGK